MPVADTQPVVDASRFNGAGAWAAPPEQWVEDIEDRLGAAQLGGLIRSTLEQMPERQRAVVMLRDVDGLKSDEVCQVLDLSPGE